MSFDAERIIQAALKAALEEPAPSPARERRPLLSTGRAMLIGAGAVAAGRLAIRMRGGRLIETLHERLAEYDERTSPRDENPAPEGEDEEFDPEDEDEEFAPDEEGEAVPVARNE